MGRKKILADFKKKTHKVGKKLTPTNQTKIKVKTKKIWLPNQNIKVASDSGRNEKEELLHLVKHLKGQSDNGRINALQKISAIFASPEATSQVLETVPLIFPAMLELLFDDERDIREQLVAALSELMAILPFTVFAAVSALFSSTLRSALNHFNKTVCKDAMILLCEALQLQPEAMRQNTHKLYDSVVAILHNKSLVYTFAASAVTQAEENSNKKVSFTVAPSNTANNNTVACATTNTTNNTTTVNSNSNEKSSKVKSGESERQHGQQAKATLFQSALQALSLLLALTATSTVTSTHPITKNNNNTNNANDSNSSKNIWLLLNDSGGGVTDTRLSLPRLSSLLSARLLSHLPGNSSNSVGSISHSHSLSDGASNNKNDNSNGGNARVALLTRLLSVWSDLTHNCDLQQSNANSSDSNGNHINSQNNNTSNNSSKVSLLPHETLTSLAQSLALLIPLLPVASNNTCSTTHTNTTIDINNSHNTHQHHQQKQQLVHLLQLVCHHFPFHVVSLDLAVSRLVVAVSRHFLVHYPEHYLAAETDSSAGVSQLCHHTMELCRARCVSYLSVTYLSSASTSADSGSDKISNNSTTSNKLTPAKNAMVQDSDDSVEDNCDTNSDSDNSSICSEEEEYEKVKRVRLSHTNSNKRKTAAAVSTSISSRSSRGVRGGRKQGSRGQEAEALVVLSDLLLLLPLQNPQNGLTPKNKNTATYNMHDNHNMTGNSYESEALTALRKSVLHQLKLNLSVRQNSQLQYNNATTSNHNTNKNSAKNSNSSNTSSDRLRRLLALRLLHSIHTATDNATNITNTNNSPTTDHSEEIESEEVQILKLCFVCPTDINNNSITNEEEEEVFEEVLTLLRHRLTHYDSGGYDNNKDTNKDIVLLLVNMMKQMWSQYQTLLEIDKNGNNSVQDTLNAHSISATMIDTHTAVMVNGRKRTRHTSNSNNSDNNNNSNNHSTTINIDTVKKRLMRLLLEVCSLLPPTQLMSDFLLVAVVTTVTKSITNTTSTNNNKNINEDDIFGSVYRNNTKQSLSFIWQQFMHSHDTELRDTLLLCLTASLKHQQSNNNYKNMNNNNCHESYYDVSGVANKVFEGLLFYWPQQGKCVMDILVCSAERGRCLARIAVSLFSLVEEENDESIENRDNNSNNNRNDTTNNTNIVSMLVQKLAKDAAGYNANSKTIWMIQLSVCLFAGVELLALHRHILFTNSVSNTTTGTTTNNSYSKIKNSTNSNKTNESDYEVLCGTVAHGLATLLLYSISSSARTVTKYNSTAHYDNVFVMHVAQNLAVQTHPDTARRVIQQMLSFLFTDNANNTNSRNTNNVSTDTNFIVDLNMIEERFMLLRSLAVCLTQTLPQSRLGSLSSRYSSNTIIGDTDPSYTAVITTESLAEVLKEEVSICVATQRHLYNNTNTSSSSSSSSSSSNSDEGEEKRLQMMRSAEGVADDVLAAYDHLAALYKSRGSHSHK